MKHDKNSDFLSALKMSLPMIVGYFILGFAYGFLMQQANLHIFWTFLMSSFVFAGALQYAAIPLLTGIFQPLVAFVLALAINVRHVFYGLSISDRYSGSTFKKFVLLFTMADEAFSINISSKHQNKNRQNYYLIISLLGYLSWIAFTTLGHYLSSTINVSIKGLEFALPALFYVMFLSMFQQKEKRLFMIIGVTTTLISLYLIQGYMFVIGAMFLILIALFLTNKETTHE